MKPLSREQINTIKINALKASEKYDTAMLLDNNFCENAFGIRHVEFIAALGCDKNSAETFHAFDELKKFVDENKHKYVFAWLSYDLKNQLEKLQSKHNDSIRFEVFYAFTAEKLIVIDHENKCIEGEEWLDQLLIESATDQPIVEPLETVLAARITKDQYIDDVQSVRNHIIEGDVYELNYCTEFFAENVSIKPESVYQKLIQKSPVPFAAFVKHQGRYLMCASPERFITKLHERTYSQPIKGTSPRSKIKKEDDFFKEQLLASEKERAENLMIVDLVRNDLARTAKTGSVKVDELFGIYRFPQVHQMISTVSSQQQENISNVDVIKNAFPMGSMTGAPKVMAMKLIEKHERTKRGLYSGAVGYFSPDGSYDFNVVIRSIQYNSLNNYLNFEVGSAITYDSIPEQEYNECLLKASAMIEVLQGK